MMNDEANTVATSVMKTKPLTLRRTDRGADLDLDLEPILSTRMVAMAMAMEMAWRAPSLRTAFDRGESLGETSRPCFDVEKPSDGTTRRLKEDKEGAWYVYGSSRASERREVLVGAGGGNATYKRLNVWPLSMLECLVCPPPAIYLRAIHHSYFF